MRLLLDTVTFLFACLQPARLSPVAAALIEEPGNEVHLSAVSAFEIAIKFSLGKLPLPEPPISYLPAQRAKRDFAELPLNEAAAIVSATLPAHHRDPFDRLLIAQAIVHGLVLVSPDATIRRYDVPIAW